MHCRGRSRDVSPAAIARSACTDELAATLALNLIASSLSNLPQPDAYAHPAPPRAASPPRRAVTTTAIFPAEPVASTSQLPPSPVAPPPLSTSPDLPRSTSSSTLASSPDEPLTPPDSASSPYPARDYDSPPSPPHTLHDQMQTAYALDDMHTAKVLLLRLRGVDVRGADDPRIAAVRDEDFSSCFVPPGGLPLDAADAQRCREGAAREEQRRRRAAREQRLQACAALWERTARAVREEKARVARRREEDARARRRQLIHERARERELVAERTRAETRPRHRRVGSLGARPLLSYDSLPHERAPAEPASPPPAQQELYEYPVVPYSLARSPSAGECGAPDEHMLSLPRARHELAVAHSRSVGRAVPFGDVVASMRGALFAPALEEAFGRRSPEQMELLQSLLCADEWPQDAPALPSRATSRTGIRAPAHPGRAASASLAATSASLASTSTAVSASSPARSSSWFSFGSSRSRESVATAVTTPPASPLSPPRKGLAFLPAAAPSPLAAVFTAKRAASRPPPACLAATKTHPLSPLAAAAEDDAAPSLDRGRPRTRAAPRTPEQREQSANAEGLVQRVSQSVAILLDAASSFQRAYAKATMFSVGVDARARSPSRSPSAQRSAGGRSAGPKPPGYRALAPDVLAFTAALARLDADAHPARSLIPLAAPHDRLRVFAPPAPAPRSPFRPADAPAGPRLRPVANPLLLRLHALQNVCARGAVAWEGRAREGRMAAGREKMLGVAWEGIGRSGLGWEVAPGAC